MTPLPCPDCSTAIESAADAAGDRVVPEWCPDCGGKFVVAYRYRLAEHRGEVAGGELYKAIDQSTGQAVGVMFCERSQDGAIADRFVEGYRAFADLAAPGVIAIHDVGLTRARRAYAVTEWLVGTLEQRVVANGPLGGSDLAAVAANLLGALAYAHRAMPAVIHGNVHPGKIGFTAAGAAVLFGFEWAERALEQDSRLADAFVSGSEDAPPSKRAADLRQLAQSLAYAGSGHWGAEESLEVQRARVEQQLGAGPLARALDRMLIAGSEQGYRSGVDARQDLRQLMEGTDAWRPRTLPRALSASELPDAEEDPEDQEWFPLNDDDAGRQPSRAPELSAASPAFASAMPAASTGPPPAAAPAPAQRAKRPMIVFAAVVVAAMGIGVFTALEGDESTYVEAEAPSVQVEPIPPEPIPAREPHTLPGYAITPDPPGTAFAQHRWGAVVVGPATGLAGLEIGDACDVFVGAPGPGSNFNCRVQIDCGEPRQRIYGGGGAGYNDCEFDEQGHPNFAQDPVDDDGDAAMVFDRREDARLVRVRDRFSRPALQVELQVFDGDGLDRNPAVPESPAVRRTDVPAPLPEVEPGEPVEPVEPVEPDSRDDSLPETLTATQLRTGLNAARGDLQTCDVERGTKIRVTVTVSGAGRVSTLQFPDDTPEDAEGCITRALMKAEFPEFSGDSLTVKWPITW